MIPSLLLIAFLCSCSRKQPLSHSNTDSFNAAVDTTLLVGTSTHISQPPNAPKNMEIDYEWETNEGTIMADESGAKYTAPLHPCIASIDMRAFLQDSMIYHYSTKFLIHKQFVILKADDIIYDKKTILPERWFKFIQLIQSRHAKAALGIIGHYLDKGDATYCRLLKELDASSTFELWNHGYTHSVGGSALVNPELPSEFYLTSLEEQIMHLYKTQDLARQKLDINLHTFGAPGNAIDQNTTFTVESCPDIWVWFFGDPKSNTVVLKRGGEIEFPTPNANFEEFSKRYDPNRNCYVYQIHPNKWDDQQFSEFTRILDFLLEQQVTFINPAEYYMVIKKRNDLIIEEVITGY